jgi:CSLREA domain-containing protein
MMELFLNVWWLRLGKNRLPIFFCETSRPYGWRFAFLNFLFSYMSSDTNYFMKNKKMNNQKQTFVIYFAIIFALILTTVSASQAATFTVNTIADAHDPNPGDGICGDSNEGCSLRAALEEANELPGEDHIQFSSAFEAPNPPNKIVLRFGQLSIHGNITISGPGARQISVDADYQSSVLRVYSSPFDFVSVARISDLTFQNGYLWNNSYSAAGINNSSSYLRLERVTIRSNRAVGDNLSLTTYGGGIYNDEGNVVLDSCTVNSNESKSYGGGIYNDGDMEIKNSTISGNMAQLGGGISSEDGKIRITNSTIANNWSVSGGGIWNLEDLYLKNTIIANNLAQDCPDLYGSFDSMGYNLVENRQCSSGYVPWDLPEGTDPKLGVLKNNGGSTNTYALLPDSPAIDAGKCPVGNCSGNDQRGFGFPRKVGSAIDIGAYEYWGEIIFVIYGGKVLKPNGSGLSEVIVTMTDSGGEALTTRTDEYGNFSFDNIRTGESYIIKVESRDYNYAPQELFVTEARDDVIFVPVETR